MNFTTFSLLPPFFSPFQASIHKLTWREINFEALRPPGRKENESGGGGVRRQEMPIDVESVRERLVTGMFLCKSSEFYANF